jgi:hypothetical protein
MHDPSNGRIPITDALVVGAIQPQTRPLEIFFHHFLMKTNSKSQRKRKFLKKLSRSGKDFYNFLVIGN